MERVRPISRHLRLDTQTMRGRVDSRTWNLPDDLSEDEWIEAGIVLAKIGASMMWWVGDYWIYGDKKYGGRKAIVHRTPGAAVSVLARDNQRRRSARFQFKAKL
jgi:hypothetical protein